MLYVLCCGSCTFSWEVRGSRLDDLSGFDLEDGKEETCPRCGHAQAVLTGDEDVDNVRV
jgi:transcription elongation factor Elf1